MSLIITKNSTNTIVCTLAEKTTLNPVYYLFEFRNTDTNNKTYCIASEQSTELERYNKFTITEQTNPDKSIGQVNLSIGEYEYKVYEQSVTTNFNPSGLNVVEIGMAYCNDSTTNTNEEYASGSTTNLVYNG